MKSNEEIIEESINFIFIHQNEGGSYCDTGEDMEMQCRSECSDYARERALKIIKRIINLKDEQARFEKIELVESVPDVNCIDIYCEGCELKNLKKWKQEKLTQLKDENQ